MDFDVVLRAGRQNARVLRISTRRSVKAAVLLPNKPYNVEMANSVPSAWLASEYRIDRLFKRHPAQEGRNVELDLKPRYYPKVIRPELGQPPLAQIRACRQPALVNYVRDTRDTVPKRRRRALLSHPATSHSEEPPT